MKKKVCIWLTGGLGNQLFQYALGCRISREIADVQIRFDPGNFEVDFRVLELDKLISTINVTRFNRLIFHRPKVQKLLEVFYPSIREDFYTLNESSGESIEEIIRRIRNAKSVYLQGYWQRSEIYASVVKSLAETVDLSSYLNEGLVDYSAESIVIHSRLSDYLSQTNSQTFCQLDDSYYIQGIEKLGFTGKRSKLVIFTDSPDLFKSKFHFWREHECVFASDYCSNSIEEFASMTRFAKFVIANSTFSYWATLIAQSSHKIERVLPKSYFQDNLKNERYKNGGMFVFDEYTYLV